MQWTEDSLLVFEKTGETTHVLSSEAGFVLDALMTVNGVAVSAYELANINSDAKLEPEVIAHALEQLCAAGIIRACANST
mgnify:CR=1 FL=1